MSKIIGVELLLQLVSVLSLEHFSLHVSQHDAYCAAVPPFSDSCSFVSAHPSSQDANKQHANTQQFRHKSDRAEAKTIKTKTTKRKQKRKQTQATPN